METAGSRRKIQWHPAFCSAVQLVFQEETISLEYLREYTLNTKPLQMDLLVIKKPVEYRLKNSLGHLFKGHNIMEYKSPGDLLGIDTYYKVYGYACLYKAAADTENAILAEDITISLVRNEKPVTLLNYLMECGYQITVPYAGIYYVKKDGFIDTQIVVTGELEDDTQIWLRALAPKLEPETLGRLMARTRGIPSQGKKTLMDSVMQVVLSANREWLAKRKGEDLEMCEALRELMADEIKAELTKAEALGTAIGETQGRIKGKLELLYSFVKRNDWTLKQAAKELNMTEEQFMEQVHSFGLDK